MILQILAVLIGLPIGLFVACLMVSALSYSASRGWYLGVKSSLQDLIDETEKLKKE